MRARVGRYACDFRSASTRRSMAARTMAVAIVHRPVKSSRRRRHVGATCHNSSSARARRLHRCGLQPDMRGRQRRRVRASWHMRHDERRVGNCMWRRGWTGALCRVPACPGTPNAAATRAACVRAVTTASCTCHGGFDGERAKRWCAERLLGMRRLWSFLFWYAGMRLRLRLCRRGLLHQRGHGHRHLGSEHWWRALALGLVFGLFAYCVRASRAGRVVGPSRLTASGSGHLRHGALHRYHCGAYPKALANNRVARMGGRFQRWRGANSSESVAEVEPEMGWRT